MEKNGKKTKIVEVETPESYYTDALQHKLLRKLDLLIDRCIWIVTNFLSMHNNP